MAIRMKVQNQARDEAIARLKEWLRPGDTVYTILRHVSRSGLRRTIGLVINRNGAMLHPNHAAATAIGYTLKTGAYDGITVDGGGMDMGYHLVYNLGRALWPDGYGCVGEKCRSNDHSNGDRDRTADPSPFAPPADVRIVTYMTRTEEDPDNGIVFGIWGSRDMQGKRELRRGTLPSLYLFDDEITSDRPADRHWHQDGGYALRHEWL